MHQVVSLCKQTTFRWDFAFAFGSWASAVLRAERFGENAGKSIKTTTNPVFVGLVGASRVNEPSKPTPIHDEIEIPLSPPDSGARRRDDDFPVGRTVA
jgi:hypothetical protein